MGNTLYNVFDNCVCKLDCFDYEIDVRDEDQNKGIIKPSLSIRPINSSPDSSPDSSPIITPRNETIAYGVTYNF